MGIGCMNVLLDARSVSRTGIGTYTRMLIYGLLNQKKINLLLMGEPEELSWVKGKVRIVPTTNSIYSVWEQFSTAVAEMRAKGIDLVHYTNYNKSLVSRHKYIITLHDLIQFKFNYGGRVKATIARALLYNSLMNASGIICVSHSTRNSLMSMFPEIDQNKVFVVHNPALNPIARLCEYTKPKEKYNLSRYILYVGNRKPHKNLKVLVRAFKLLTDSFPDLRLVIVGRKFEKIDEVDVEISKTNLVGKIICLENITYDEVTSLYKDADLTVLPSVDEGFGLVPFESIAQGTLPLVSDIPVMRELFFKEEEIFFDPNSPEDLATKISVFLQSEAKRDELVKKLYNYLEVYSFERFIESTVAVYEKVCNS